MILGPWPAPRPDGGLSAHESELRFYKRSLIIWPINSVRMVFCWAQKCRILSNFDALTVKIEAMVNYRQFGTNFWRYSW